MPTYEYACRECGEHLEVVQSFSDDPLTVCPSCDGALRKVFSAAGIIFKGSGWHIKDYAATSGKGAPASSSDGEGQSSENGSSKDSSSKVDAKKNGSAKEGSARGGAAKGSPASSSKDAGGSSKASSSTSSASSGTSDAA